MLGKDGVELIKRFLRYDYETLPTHSRSIPTDTHTGTSPASVCLLSTPLAPPSSARPPPRVSDEKATHPPPSPIPPQVIQLLVARSTITVAVVFTTRTHTYPLPNPTQTQPSPPTGPHCLLVCMRCWPFLVAGVPSPSTLCRQDRGHTVRYQRGGRLQSRSLCVSLPFPCTRPPAPGSCGYHSKRIARGWGGKRAGATRRNTRRVCEAKEKRDERKRSSGVDPHTHFLPPTHTLHIPPAVTMVCVRTSLLCPPFCYLLSLLAFTVLCL